MAQGELLKFGVEARVDYMRQSIDGEHMHEDSGFKGRFLNLVLSGEIGHGFSYLYRQRLNKAHEDQSFFDATDYIYLTYTTPNARWAFTAGKQAVGVGGCEYDSTPIDAYYYSEYSSNIACYQLGLTAAYTLKNGRDTFKAQVTQSPFRADDEMYAYNLMWYGSHGCFQSLYSVNAMEYLPGEYIYYIALGNRFNLGRVSLDFDLMNRATDRHAFFLQDYTLIGRVLVDVCDKVQLHAKCSYDVNHTSRPGDFCVLPGTELTRVGGGIEYYPIKGKRTVRLHAVYNYTFGSSSEMNVLQDKQSIFDVGLTWRMNILSLPAKAK